MSPSSGGTGGGLPVTGASVGLYVSVGTGLVLLGAATVVFSRRRRHAADLSS